MKGVSVYGAFETSIPVRQRYWKWAYHRTGPLAGQKWYKRRVWKTTSRMMRAVRTDARFDLWGQGRDLAEAVRRARAWVPFDYIEVDAKEFIEHPELYGEPGEWVEWRVDSL